MFIRIVASGAIVTVLACGAAVADPFAHTHETSTLGTHTHEINGVRVKHRHEQADTVAGRLQGLNRQFEARETVSRRRYQVGAGFGPYSVAEYQARAAAGQPGLVRRQEPWPGRKYRNQD